MQMPPPHEGWALTRADATKLYFPWANNRLSSSCHHAGMRDREMAAMHDESPMRCQDDGLNERRRGTRIGEEYVENGGIKRRSYIFFAVPGIRNNDLSSMKSLT